MRRTTCCGVLIVEQPPLRQSNRRGTERSHPGHGSDDAVERCAGSISQSRCVIGRKSGCRPRTGDAAGALHAETGARAPSRDGGEGTAIAASPGQGGIAVRPGNAGKLRARKGAVSNGGSNFRAMRQAQPAYVQRESAGRRVGDQATAEVGLALDKSPAVGASEAGKIKSCAVGLALRVGQIQVEDQVGVAVGGWNTKSPDERGDGAAR